MRQPLLVALIALLFVAARGLINPTARPATPTPAATATRSGSPAASTPVPATALLPTLPAPTPTELGQAATAFVEGLYTRLGTPDPNPNCPDHYPWFFENPADECAAIILNTWTVWQPFEHGLMVWTQEGGRTYVLSDDGSPFKPYVIVSDPLGLPLPEPYPSIVPPNGLFQPERGSALFWRGLVPGHEWVRQRLGWATAPELAYSGFLQCRTDTGAAARCYLNGPHDEIIVLAGSVGWWTYVQGAVR